MSNVLAPTICVTGKACYASEAGFYDRLISNSDVTIDRTGSVYNRTFTPTPGALPTLFGNANWMVDTVKLSIQNGAAGNTERRQAAERTSSMEGITVAKNCNC